ncbi:MAG: hypothetical protein ABI670_11605 [Chloroflexota bacterium]
MQHPGSPPFGGLPTTIMADGGRYISVSSKALHGGYIDHLQQIGDHGAPEIVWGGSRKACLQSTLFYYIEYGSGVEPTHPKMAAL